ncbi:MAG: hypothetical protein ACI7YS_01085 [Flavobacterium sp.]
MKNKHLVKIAITAILIIGIPSCDPCGDLNDPVVINYKVKGFEDLQTKSKQNGVWTTIKNDNSISIDSLMFELIPIKERDYVATQKRSQSKAFFIPSSYACDFVTIENIDKSIIDFSIFSTNDINANYPAGSDLTDLFDTSRLKAGPISLKQYLKQSPKYLLEDNKHFFWLKQHPTIKGKHSFTFKITLNDTTITKTTEEILIE